MTELNDICLQLKSKFGQAQETAKTQWNALSPQERQQRLDEDARRKAQEERTALLARYKACGIPPRYHNATWDNWEAATSEMQNALAQTRKAWTDNLLLSGKNGTGKTHLAMCLVKDGASYRRFATVLRQIKSDFNSEEDALNSPAAKKLLILDEIGRSDKASEFERNTLFEVIDRRYNNMLPTTLITNMTAKEFVAAFGQALIDRFRPLIINFNWESKRRHETIGEAEDDIVF